MTTGRNQEKRLLGLRFFVWGIILLLLVTGGLTWLWFTYIDKVYYQRDLGYKDEVLRNPYYAAAKYLNQLGVPAETLRNYDILDQLPGTGATIFIETSRVGLSQFRLENLATWVRRGGHLVLVATETYDAEFNETGDKFFDELKLRVYEKPKADRYNKTENSYTFNGYEQPTKVLFKSQFYLHDASGKATFDDSNNDYAQLIQYDYGEGMVTALASMDPFSNYQIDDRDHAMMLAQLIGTSDQAYFVYNLVQPGLWDLLVQNVPELVIAFFITLIILIATLSVRSGPRIGDELPVHRELRQHLEAAADFNYRTDMGAAIGKALLQYLEILMRPHISGYAALTPTKQIKKVSQKLNVPASELKILWQTDAIDTESLLKKTILVQQIRKQL